MLRSKPHGKKTSHLKIECDWPGCDNEFFTARGPYDARELRCIHHRNATTQRTLDNRLLSMLGLRG